MICGTKWPLFIIRTVYDTWGILFGSLRKTSCSYESYILYHFCRWGHTPLTEAREFGHNEVEQLILEFSKSGKYTPKWKAVIESDIIHGTQNSTKKVKA